MTNPPAPDSGIPADLIVFSQRSVPVRQLSGYRKTHFSAGNSPARQRYLGQIGHQDLENGLDAVFEWLRQQLGCRRVDLNIVGPESGAGLATTPYFDVELCLQPGEDDTRCWYRIMISAIRRTELLTGTQLDGLLQLFGPAISGLQLTPASEIDVPRLIDHVESQEAAGWQVDYDREATWCDLHLRESALQVRIRSERIVVVGAGPAPVAELVRAWADFQRHFAALIPGSDPAVID